MEPTEVIIARLVLGYLKNEHCMSAYKAFLGSSSHFHNNSLTKNKYLPTRFVGLTLEDILNEYFEIYLIVQGRLEATNYFNEKHAKTSLPNQLVYLLSKGRSISRASTPCPRSPNDSHLDDTSPSNQDPNSDVETTPAHTLPGNIRCSKEETYLQKTPRKKHKTVSPPEEDIEEMAEVAVDTEVLAQTLLENREFHEKIAQTINKVAEKQHRVSAGLDKTIKTVVKETEEDPMFDKILDEIIGTTNIMDNRFETTITSSSVSYTESDGLDNRLNESNKKTDVNDTRQVERSTEIGVQNPEDVQSTVSNATIVSKNIPPVNVGQINNEVVVLDAPLDRYIVNSGCSLVTAPIQKPMYINTMGFLIPTNVQQNLNCPTENQFFINNSQVNWNVPLDTVTNQDIMSMPTVIVTEKKVPAKRTSGEQKKEPKSSKPNNIPEILPKPLAAPEVSSRITKPSMLMDTQEPKLHSSIPEATGLKKVIYPKETSMNLCEGSSQPSVVSHQPLSTSTPACSKFVNDLPEIMTEKENANLTEETDKINRTPPPSENIQKITPKSGSHIRNLDFSTPPKGTSRSKKKRRLSKCPSKKQAVKSLFKKEVQSKNDDLTRVWDSDLRAVISHTDLDPKNKDTPKRVTKRSSCKSTKRKTKNNEKSDMNTTEQDAAALEAALKSPIKIVDSSTEGEDVQKTSVIVESDSKSVDNPSEEVTLEVTKEKAEDTHSKTILSPSKLNANKRNLLETKDDAKTKYITPESAKENIIHPIKANRNIMPMLETPLKDYVPKTPGIETPMALNVSSMSSNMTPFTKMLQANLKGMDINQLPTPNMAITPNFTELTPIIDLVSPFSNRPTDYSTSSSYYQPSDNEQNKSLEAHLMEMEKKSLGERIEAKTAPTNEHLNTFNKNIVGRKNLNLVKHNMSCSSSSSDESSVDSQESDSSGADKKEKSNDTVIFRKTGAVSPVRTYCLRVRNATGQVQKEPGPNKDLAKIENEVNIKKTNLKPVKKGVKIKQIEGMECDEQSEKSSISKNHDPRKSFIQKSVTTELEEKRLRVLNQIKNSNTKKKARQNKIIKIKPLNVNTKKRTRKSVTPKKISTPKKEDMRTILMHDLANSDDSDWEVPSPKTSPNPKTVKNMDIESTVEKNEVSTSDIEAQNLIEGLKERGIHLMHNKSPKKTVKDTPQSNELSSSLIEENKSLNASSEERIQADQHSILLTEDRDIYDIQVFEEETLSLVYDEKNPSQKTFEDYNTGAIIDKTMKTQIFVEDVNLDIDINLKVSQFYSLLEILPKEDVVPKKIDKPDDNNEVVIETDGTIINKTNKMKYDKIRDPRIKTVIGKSESDVCKSIKLDNESKEVKSVRSDDMDKNIQKSKESNQVIEESCEPKSKQIIILDDKCISKPKTDLNKKSEDLDPVKKSITKNADGLQETSTKETIPASTPLDDDLMNYAVMGDKEETSDCTMSRKRKASMEGNTQNVKKCKKILKKIDVDQFLNNIHANDLEM